MENVYHFLFLQTHFFSYCCYIHMGGSDMSKIFFPRNFNTLVCSNYMLALTYTVQL